MFRHRVPFGHVRILIISYQELVTVLLCLDLGQTDGGIGQPFRQLVGVAHLVHETVVLDVNDLRPAKELARDRIRVNCVAPAWTDTDMARGPIARIGRDKVVAGFPLGRIGRPEDAAGATVYLLSDLAQFVTGMTLTVDGGMDMRG